METETLDFWYSAEMAEAERKLGQTHTRRVNGQPYTEISTSNGEKPINAYKDTVHVDRGTENDIMIEEF